MYEFFLLRPYRGKNIAQIAVGQVSDENAQNSVKSIRDSVKKKIKSLIISIAFLYIFKNPFNSTLKLSFNTFIHSLLLSSSKVLWRR